MGPYTLFKAARVSRSAGTVARCTTAQRTARVDTDTSPVGATGAATRRSHRRAQKTCAHAEGGTEGGTWSCRRRAGLPDTDGAAVDGALLSMACCRWPAVDGACCRRRVGDDLARGAWRGACRLFGCRGPKKRRRAADTCGPPGCWCSTTCHHVLVRLHTHRTIFSTNFSKFHNRQLLLANSRAKCATAVSKCRGGEGRRGQTRRRPGARRRRCVVVWPCFRTVCGRALPAETDRPA